MCVISSAIINRTQARRTVSHPSSSMGKSRHLLPAGAFSSPFMRRITPRCNCSPTRCLRNRSHRPRCFSASSHIAFERRTSPSENAGGGSSRGEKTPKFPVFHILKSLRSAKPLPMSAFSQVRYFRSVQSLETTVETGNFGVKPSAWPHFVRLEQSASGPHYGGPAPFRATFGRNASGPRSASLRARPIVRIMSDRRIWPKTAPSREPTCDPPQATATPAQ